MGSYTLFRRSFLDYLKSNKPIIVMATLYPVAITTSMALMELLCWVWALLGIIYLALNRKEINFYKSSINCTNNLKPNPVAIFGL